MLIPFISLYRTNRKRLKDEEKKHIRSANLKTPL